MIRLTFEGHKVRVLSPNEKKELERVRRLFPEAQVTAGFEIRDIHDNWSHFDPFEPALDE